MMRHLVRADLLDVGVAHARPFDWDAVALPGLTIQHRQRQFIVALPIGGQHGEAALIRGEQQWRHRGVRRKPE